MKCRWQEIGPSLRHRLLAWLHGPFVGSVAHTFSLAGVSEQPSLVWYMSIRGWRKVMAPFWLSRRGKRVAAVTVHREHQPVASCELALSRFWCKDHPRCQGQALNGALLSGAQVNTRLLPTAFHIHTSDFFSKFFRYPREG